ncbi:DUF4407 domain-containing protein [Kangiella sp. HZ709]|uniref:DUF4407 domain-containing protein n=1 Tax=Kangiella sp. HZ709 TaxID=2666328 RepID=UPI0012B14A37|nr:DUF4407 domain-containing protein [Kangiella sp. HZ709]MRX26610.1 DUF4407 domain-containing protein [Kangiella sp. HZ709]
MTERANEGHAGKGASDEANKQAAEESAQSENKAEQNDSLFFKIISFLSLTDSQVLADCGKYDRMLAYAMVGRQLVTFAFTFMLFSYGVSLFLGTTAAIVIGFIFALTLFFLDQAIIGSDWALRNPFKNGLPVRTLVGLIPRIIYSLIIAIGLATLAEISLQSTAIDEQIQKDSNQNNREYFSRLNDYEKELDTAIDVDKRRIADLQIQIEQLRNNINNYKATEQSSDPDVLKNNLNVKQTNLSELQKSQQVLISEIAALNQRIADSRKEYDYWFNEALLERTGKDGRAPTEGPKYQRAVKTYTDLEQQIVILETRLTDSKSRLDALSPQVVAATDGVNEVQKESNLVARGAVLFESNSTTLANLETSILEAKTQLDQQIEKKQQKLEEYRVTLVNDGLFYEVKTGFLRRYLGLQSIHNDPEIGQAAILFSWLLKIFFIAIELMPVIIKLFFSPFSFYSLKMYRKMNIALMEEKTLMEVAEEEHRQSREERLSKAREMETVSF